ncbi:uncharacterized protein LOC128729192 [Anopheles nili]|uniref:uncharacterized protein LOC128729192 n=1 Tax=Anopheles nili TaxID=185578 RepID=UPI00237AE76C|nr:uncharacterized protein LOC128729192 [Anopheles nili]
MEQIVTSIVCFLVISAIVRVGSAPAPSDIISGREFLSILMKPTAGASAATPQQPARGFRGLRKFRHFFYDRSTTGDDSILPIEALFTSQEDLDRSSTRLYDYGQDGTTPIPGVVVSEVQESESTTTVTEDGDPTTPRSSTAEVGTEQTTVEDVTDLVEDVSVSTVEPPTRTLRYGKRAKAIQQPVEYAKVTSTHSNSHRSELSVEELGPTISKEEERDSARGESAMVSKLAVASSTPTQQRYRTQRKQESKGGPYQAVSAFHDSRKPLDTLTWRDVNTDYRTGEVKPAAKESRSEGESKVPLKSASRPKPRQTYSEPARFYSEPAQFYSEPAKVYSEPAKVYGEPEKVYSEPARVYSEPAKVYGEPAKVYSEPAKVYSEPAKIYSQPSSYWQTAYSPINPLPTTTTMAMSTGTTASTTTSPTEVSFGPISTTTGPARLVFNELDKIPYDQLNAPTVDGVEAGSIHNAIGKFVPKQNHVPDRPDRTEPQEDVPPSSPVVQTLAPVLGSGDDSKVGYVVEGRNYRKYRVEEKTPDGFIVGEYGVLSHNDGNLRGVRYTADSDINPRLIYDALLKFLSL